MAMPCAAHHSTKASAVSSGPLSTRRRTRTDGHAREGKRGVVRGGASPLHRSPAGLWVSTTADSYIAELLAHESASPTVGSALLSAAVTAYAQALTEARTGDGVVQYRMSPLKRTPGFDAIAVLRRGPPWIMAWLPKQVLVRSIGVLVEGTRKGPSAGSPLR